MATIKRGKYVVGNIVRVRSVSIEITDFLKDGWVRGRVEVHPGSALYVVYDFHEKDIA